MTNSPPADDAYIDYGTFLSPTFSPYLFANAIILHTNSANDPNLDLSTPLSRVLFDLQEIDSHIHNITSSNSTELLSYAKESGDISSALVSGLEKEVKVLNGVYKRLEKEVVAGSEMAEEVVRVAERLASVTGVLRRCARCVVLGRKLEGEVGEIMVKKPGGSSIAEDNHKSLLRACFMVVELRRLLEEKVGSSSRIDGSADDGLGQLNIVQTIVTHLLLPTESFLKTTAQTQLANFALPVQPGGQSTGSGSSSSSFAAQKTFKQLRGRMSSVMQILYLLSSTTQAISSRQITGTNLLIISLTNYLSNQTTSSLAALSRVFSSLTPSTPSPPALDRSLSEGVMSLRSILYTIFWGRCSILKLYALSLPLSPEFWLRS